MFALSLSWNSSKFRSTEKQIQEVRNAGFSDVELNFSLTENNVKAIESLKRKGLISVTSCHNYCPIPSGLSVKVALPDYYSLSSLKEKNRLLAVKATKRTIDTAAGLGASAIVVHSGRVEIPDASKKLMRLFSEGKAASPEFRRLADGMREMREENKRPYLDSVITSLREVSSYALIKGIKVGLENRIYYPEIPHLDEFGLLLDIPGIFFWFDTGHAHVIEKLWSIKSGEYLKRYSSKLIGMHLHDCLGVRDHLAPGTGEIDYSFLRPYAKPGIIKVIEAHQPATAQELRQSVIKLERIFN